MAQESSDIPERPQAREGMFDAQLTFGVPFAEGPQPIAHIVKRNGRLEPFATQKIAEAIFRAAQSIGGTDSDRAKSLASGVAIYLAKELNGKPPTVDQVDDAVEKVLIEMGHARTALTYARFRDKRARVRNLSKGDTRDILNELAEARRAREHEPVSGALLVRTSGEKLAGWNSARIAEALVRETGLDDGMASVIALEVEQQILLAKVKTLTAPLVRELVNAKLIEHGLAENLRRHMRLGVPLFDTERIICGPDADAGALDPDATGRVLAESVKREYALSQVFSEEVADAHLRGDLYIHHLDKIDRLHGAEHSIEAITRFGLGAPDSATSSKPPKYTNTLLAQMANSSASLQAHFAGPFVWHALNSLCAPFVYKFDDRALRQVAQMFIYECAYRAPQRDDRFLGIDLSWETPGHLRHAEAVLPGGVIAEAVYGDYILTAQQFAWALFEVLKAGGAGGTPFPVPVPLVHITPQFFKTDGHEQFLDLVAETAGLRGNVRFIFDRTDRTDPTDQNAEIWQPRNVVVQEVTLNLPRIACACGERGTVQEEELLYALARAVEVAARAQCQKRDFIENLFKREALGPLALLTIRHDGKPSFKIDEAFYLVGVTGLNECVQATTGRQLHESEEALKLGVRILNHVGGLCKLWSTTLDLNLTLAASHAPQVDRRFAALDLEAFPGRAGQIIKSDLKTNNMFYTSGTRLHAPPEMSPFEQAQLEGRLHACLPRGAITAISLPDADTSHRAIMDFVQKIYHHTTCRGIQVG